MSQTWEKIWIFDFGPVTAPPYNLNPYVFVTFYFWIILCYSPFQILVFLGSATEQGSRLKSK